MLQRRNISAQHLLNEARGPRGRGERRGKMGQVNEASIWLERVAALEGVLGRAGRTDLLTAAATVRLCPSAVVAHRERFEQRREAEKIGRAHV